MRGLDGRQGKRAEARSRNRWGRGILLSVVTLVLAGGWFFQASAQRLQYKKRPDVENGAKVYKGGCIACHGADGKGDTPAGKKMNVKDLASDDVQKQSDADLAGVIEKGKKPMPGYEGKITKEQIDGLVKWIRTLKK